MADTGKKTLADTGKKTLADTGKKTLGRRKIEIKKIEKKSSLHVTFTKRRNGLFKKASELTLLCGAQIAILVQSPAEKMYTFGHPSVEHLIHCFSTASVPPPLTPQITDGRGRYLDAVIKLEMEKRRALAEGPESNLKLHELEEYLQDLQIMMDQVSKKLGEMGKGSDQTAE